MENNVEGDYCVPNSELFNIWREKHNEDDKRAAISAYFFSYIAESDCSENFKQYIKEQSRIFCSNMNMKWHKSSKNLNVFEKRHAVWLKGNTMIRKRETQTASTKSKPGRPQLTFCQKSDRTKRRVAAEISKDQKKNEVEPLVLAASVAARKCSQLDLAVVLKETVSTPTRAAKVRKLISRATPTKLSADEGLAFLLENNFSKEQYCNIRYENKMRNSDIYPLYKELTCRPDGAHWVEIAKNGD